MTKPFNIAGALVALATPKPISTKDQWRYYCDDCDVEWFRGGAPWFMRCCCGNVCDPTDDHSRVQNPLEAG